MATLEELRAQRIAHAKRLQDHGVQTYPSKTTRSHTVAEVIDQFDSLLKTEKPFTLAGRIMSWRGHGKTAFFDLQDASGRMQVYAKVETYDQATHDLIEALDLGDFISATGTAFVTKMGEKTLRVTSLTLLAKALRPLPEKWHGLKDVEKRYRQRYLDLLVNTEAREKIIKRDVIIRALREFLATNGFMESQFPTFELSASGALARPFATHSNAFDLPLYLRICVGELWQKQMMVAGFEKTFEIGQAFRNEGVDAEHNPDFTLLEYYWAYANYEDNMTFQEQLFAFVVEKTHGTLNVPFAGYKIDFTPPYPRKTFYALFKEWISFDVTDQTTADDIANWMHAHNIPVEPGAGRGKLLDNLYKETIRPKLIQPVFITDHPLDLKPLAKKKHANPNLAESFQLLVNGFEVSNNYTELNDPLDQEERFKEQAELQAGGDEEAMQYDHDFIIALEHGMPPTTGTGIGVDRLVAILTNSTTLREVMAFPLMKPQDADASQVQRSPFKIQNTHTLSEKTTPLEPERSSACSVEKALELVEKFVAPTSKPHLFAAQIAMQALAKKLGGNEELWGLAGLLHDIDWDVITNQHEEHCGPMTEKILLDAGCGEDFITAIQAHNERTGIPRTTMMAKALYAVDELTGFIRAVTLVRPSKVIADVELKSIKKKMKDKLFAANVNRETIGTCEKELGIPLDDFMLITLKAMQSINKMIGL